MLTCKVPTVECAGGDLRVLAVGPPTSREAQLMPTRRTFELMVLTIILVHPVIRMAHIWAAKHIATASPGATTTAAEVVATVL